MVALLAALSFPVASQIGAALRPSATGLCGPLENGYGPFDYRTATPAQLNLVERHHFTPPVEALMRGVTGEIGGDVDYTLRAFPNHPRALYTMVRLGEKLRSSHPPGANYPVECYFDRAIRFTPDDAQVRVLYAFYLIKGKRADEARQQLKSAEQAASTNPQILYNLGLAYLDLGEFDKSLAYAHQAYAAGVQFPGLRDRLRRAGRWRDAPAG